MENTIQDLLDQGYSYDQIREMGFDVPLGITEEFTSFNPQQTANIEFTPEEQRFIFEDIPSYPPITTSTSFYPPITTSTSSYPPITTSTSFYPPITTSTSFYPPITTSTSFYQSPLQPQRETLIERRQIIRESNLEYAQSAYTDSLKNLDLNEKELRNNLEKLKAMREEERKKLNESIKRFVDKYQDIIFKQIREVSREKEKEINEKELKLQRLRNSYRFLSPDEKSAKDIMEKELTSLKDKLEKLRSNYCVDNDIRYYEPGEIFKFKIPNIDVPFCVSIEQVIETGYDEETSFYNVNMGIVNVPINIHGQEEYLYVIYPLSPDDSQRFLKEAEVKFKIRNYPQMSNSLISDIERGKVEVDRLEKLVRDNKERLNNLSFY